MAKSVRMADIAQQLGVSVVTVSKALAGKDGVGEELRQEIQQLADKMGYLSKKNKAAQKTAYTIGVFTSYRYIERGHSFYWSLYERLLAHISAGGDIAILEIVTEEQENNCILSRLISEERVDGVIVMGNFSYAYRNALAATKIPLMMLDTFDASFQRDSVISDGYYGMYTVTDFLLRMGHRDIMFVGSPDATSSITDRYYGFCRAMREHGILVEQSRHVLPDRDEEGKIEIHLESLEHMPTAFACNCDTTAYILLNQLKEQGVSVPDDVSIVGFDNYMLAEMAVPKLTTYAVDLDRMAKCSIEQLFQRMGNLDEEIRRMVVSGYLVERESVKAMSQEDCGIDA